MAHRFMGSCELEVNNVRDKVNLVAIALVEDDIDLCMDRLACVARYPDTFIWYCGVVDV